MFNSSGVLKHSGWGNAGYETTQKIRLGQQEIPHGLLLQVNNRAQSTMAPLEVRIRIRVQLNSGIFSRHRKLEGYGELQL